MPAESKVDDDKKLHDSLEAKKCDNIECKDEKCDDCSDKDDSKRRKIKRPRKNRKAVGKEQGQCFFPMSMSMLFGPLGDQIGHTTPVFPYNVTFKQVSM